MCMRNISNMVHYFATETDAKVYYAKEISRGHKNITQSGNSVIEWPTKAKDWAELYGKEN